MKSKLLVVTVIILMLSAFTMTGCEKSEFGAANTSEKSADIAAVNADEGDYFVTGTLVVKKNEHIVIDADMEEGEIEISFLSAEGMDDIEEVPDLEGEPDLIVSVRETGTSQYDLKKGEYMIKSAALEKATGDIHIKVEKQ